MDATEKLAQGFVELATEYDWAELPDHVQAVIMEGAAALMLYTRPPTIVIGPVSGDGLARHKQIYGER